MEVASQAVNDEQTFGGFLRRSAGSQTLNEDELRENPPQWHRKGTLHSRYTSPPPRPRFSCTRVATIGMIFSRCHSHSFVHRIGVKPSDPATSVLFEFAFYSSVSTKQLWDTLRLTNLIETVSMRGLGVVVPYNCRVQLSNRAIATAHMLDRIATEFGFVSRSIANNLTQVGSLWP